MRHPLALVAAAAVVVALSGCATETEAPASSDAQGPAISAPSETPSDGAASDEPTSPVTADAMPACDAVQSALGALLPASFVFDEDRSLAQDDPEIDVERSCVYGDDATGSGIIVSIQAIPFTGDEMAALATGPTVRESQAATDAGYLVMTSDEMGGDEQALDGTVLVFDGSSTVSITTVTGAGQASAATIGATTDAAVAVHTLI